MIIDITQEILGCKIYPGDTGPRLTKQMDMDKGDLYNLSAFEMGCHNGTHMDAPAHFIKDGKTIESIPLENCVGNCYVAYHHGVVSATDAHTIMEKRKNADADRRILLAGDCVVTEEAAKVFADHKILLIGNESQSVGPENAPMSVHKILLGRGVLLLEGIVLTDVEEGRYFLSSSPVNIKGAEGAPCRAYLIKE